MTLNLAARYGAVGNNVAVLRELQLACEIGVCCGCFADGLHLPAQNPYANRRDDEQTYYHEQDRA